MTNFCERCNGSGWADASCVLLCDDCNGNGVAVPTEIELLKAENAKYKAAIMEATYRIDAGKVWNGMGWQYTGLGAHQQKRIIALLDAALAD